MKPPVLRVHFKIRHYSHSCPRSLSCYDLVSLHEQLHAVRTDDPHFLGAPDDGAALGAYPPPGAALCLGRFRCAGLAAAGCLAACSGACHIRPCQPLAHLDILPALENDEVQQLFGRARDGPAVLFVVVYDQAVCLCLLLKAPVVVDPVVAGVLDAGLHAVLVHHLMQQGGSGLLDGTVERGRRNVDLVLVLAACLPDLGTGDMTIGGRGLFQADDGLGQLACKVVLVELTEHLFQLTGSAGGFDSLFHDFLDLSLDKKGRDRYNIGVARPGGCVGLCTAQTLVGARCMGLFSGDAQAGAGDRFAVLVVQVGSYGLDGFAVESGAGEIGQADFVATDFEIVGGALCQCLADLDLQLFLFSLCGFNQLGGLLVLLDKGQ